jgi:hypothetical protein
MRNESMRDQLANVFHATQTPQEVILASSQKKDRRKPIEPILSNQNEKGMLLGPRYRTPPKHANPFQVHAFSSGYTIDRMIKDDQEPQTIPDIEESPAIEESAPEEPIPEEPIPDEPAKDELAVEDAPLEDESIEPEPTPETQPFQESTSAAAPAVNSGLPAVPSPALEEGPVVTLPSNLTWLEKPTPFSNNLSVIVNNLRDARARVSFTLEQHLLHAQEYRQKLDIEEFGAEQQRENLRVLENTISACALVAEQSMGIEPALLVFNDFHRTKGPATVARETRRTIIMPDRDDKTILRLEDVRRFFRENPGTNWTAAEILAALPAAKREHAKVYLPNVLKVMHDKDEIQRIDRGIYRALGS